MSFLEAVRFLTFIPLPPRDTSWEEVGRGTAYFPLVGALVGAILVLAGALLGKIWSRLLVSTVLVVLWVILTGGLHLDGLADTVDGLRGGRGPGDRLAIMKDSRMGTFGGVAVFCLLALKLAFVNEPGPAWSGRGLLLAPTLGRWAMVYGIWAFPSARPGGIGSIFKAHSGLRELVLATALALAVAFLLFHLWGLAILGGLWLAVALLGWALTRALGGLTGDTYGALCEVSEVLILAMVAFVGEIVAET
jgi:adenosylcobinamide-GDP ribazoletransferase